MDISWKKSLGVYGRAAGYWWWVVVISIVLGAYGTFTDAIGIPAWGWLLIITTGCLIAPFIAFHKQRMELEALRNRLDPCLAFEYDHASNQHNANFFRGMKRIRLRNNSDTQIKNAKVRYKSLTRIHPNRESYPNIQDAPLPRKGEEASHFFDVTPRGYCDIDIATAMSNGTEIVFHFYHLIPPFQELGNGSKTIVGCYAMTIEATADNHPPIAIDLLLWWSRKGAGEILMRTVPQTMSEKLNLRMQLNPLRFAKT